MLIVISDGGDNLSALCLSKVLTRAAQPSVIVYTVGIFDEESRDRNMDVLLRLARSTGAEAFFSDRIGEVVAIGGRIAHDIRNRCTIGYLPNRSAPPGAMRTIRMVAQAAGKGILSVRSRGGYVAGGVGGAT